MARARAAVEAEDLLKLLLVLAVVWLALEVLEAVLDVFASLFGFLRPLLGLVIVALIVLWLLDRI
jgi:hypothetical protein